MTTLQIMFIVAAKLRLLHENQAKDLAAARAAIAAAERTMIEYGRARMVAGEPSSLARCIINQAAARAMCQPNTGSPRLSDPGEPGAAPRGRAGTKEEL